MARSFHSAGAWPCAGCLIDRVKLSPYRKIFAGASITSVPTQDLRKAMQRGDAHGTSFRQNTPEHARTPEQSGCPPSIGAALVFLYGDDLTSLDNSSMAAPQRLDHAHARDAHGRQITSEQHRAAMPQATPSMLGVVACRRTMSSSTSNGALLLPRVVFTTKSIDEMRTFEPQSLPVTRIAGALPSGT